MERQGKGHVEEEQQCKGHVEEEQHGKGHVEEEQHGKGHVEEEQQGKGHVEEEQQGKGHVEEMQHGKGQGGEEQQGKGHGEEGQQEVRTHHGGGCITQTRVGMKCSEGGMAQATVGMQHNRVAPGTAVQLGGAGPCPHPGRYFSERDRAMEGLKDASVNMGGTLLERQDRSPLLRSGGIPLLQPDGIPLLRPDGRPLLEPDGIPLLQPDGIPLLQPEGTPLLQPEGIPLLQPDRTLEGVWAEVRWPLERTRAMRKRKLEQLVQEGKGQGGEEQQGKGHMEEEQQGKGHVWEEQQGKGHVWEEQQGKGHVQEVHQGRGQVAEEQQGKARVGEEQRGKGHVEEEQQGVRTHHGGSCTTQTRVGMQWSVGGTAQTPVGVQHGGGAPGTAERLVGTRPCPYPGRYFSERDRAMEGLKDVVADVSVDMGETLLERQDGSPLLQPDRFLEELWAEARWRLEKTDAMWKGRLEQLKERVELAKVHKRIRMVLKYQNEQVKRSSGV